MYMLRAPGCVGVLRDLDPERVQKQTGTQTQPGPSMFSASGGPRVVGGWFLCNNWGKPRQTQTPIYADGGRVMGGDGMSKLISDVSAAADGLAAIRRKCGGRVGYMDGGEVEDEYGDDGMDDFYGSSSVVPTAYPSTVAMPSEVSMSMPSTGGIAVSRPAWSGNLGLSDEAGQGLMAAGFGMMSSNSPFFLSALGERRVGGCEDLQRHPKGKRGDGNRPRQGCTCCTVGGCA